MNESFSYYVQKYFLSYLISQRNYGNNSLSSYRDTFRLMLQYICNSGHNPTKMKIRDVKQNLVLSFLQWLVTERKNSISTKNVRLAHLKSFYGFVLISAPEYSDLCAGIINIPFGKTESRPPVYMTENEVAHLFQEIDSDTKEGLRHLAILTLLYDSGCRVQELIDLNVSDMQIDKCNRIYVHGKGNKYRQIPLRPETAKITEKYISRYKLKADDILFVNRQGNRLTRQGIRHIMQKYEAMVHERYPYEFINSVHPHLMRHYGERYKMVKD